MIGLNTEDFTWKSFLDFCGHARDGLEGLSKSCDWVNLGGGLSEEQLEYCQNLISHSSLGFSLPELGSDLSGLCSAFSSSFESLSSVKVGLQINKVVGGVLHVWKDLSDLSYASLGSLESPVEMVAELTDMIGNVAELAQEIGEAAWGISFEDLVGESRIDEEFCAPTRSPKKKSPSAPIKFTVIRAGFSKNAYECAVKDHANRSKLLCLKTAGIVCSIGLGVIGMATIVGGEAFVGALITPVGVLTLGSVALVLKVAGNVFEKTICGPCRTC